MDSRIKKEYKDRDSRRVLARVATRLFVASLFLAVLLTRPAPAEVVDRVVAVVNDSVITLTELNAATALASESFGLDGSERDKRRVEMKSSQLDALIEQKLVKQSSEKYGIEVSDDEIDEAVEDVKRNNNLSQETLLIALADGGLTYKEYREQLKGQLREVKFMNAKFRSKVVISKEDLEEYYIQHSDDFMMEPAVRISVIFLSAKDKELKEARLKAVLEGLKEGRSFGELASEYSQGPGLDKGGDIGFVKLTDLDKELAGRVSKLKPGEVSKPLDASSGTSIVQLTSRRGAEPSPFEVVSGKIRNILFKQRVAERFELWLKDTKKVAHIEVKL